MSVPVDRLAAAFADRYRIERELGAGGMATVYLAEDLKHKRKVALKVLKPELAAVLGAERFVQEITTTAALQHPHILPLFDSGTADGFLYYVMPFIQGETLRDKLNRETQLGVNEAVRIAREVLDALEYAHQHGIVHRDVKPENILLRGGHAMVADFGIALALSAAAGARMTESGLSLGTPHYMSPEQATAEKDITPRSDVYSLGSVLFEMLTGNPPHTGASAQQTIMKIIADTPRPVNELRKSVPMNVAAAVAKALEKLPADRFESALAFAEALGNATYTNPSGAGGFTESRFGGPQSFKRRFIVTLAIATGLFVIALWGWLKPSPPAAVSRQRIVLWDNQQIPAGRVGRGLAISPDGGTVVFLDSTGAGTQLYAKERDRVDAAALDGTIGVAGAPTFSPDGAWIAFVSSDGKVKKFPRRGGSAITLADSANTTTPSIAWLDGGTILYLDHQFGVKAIDEVGGAHRQVFQAAADSMSMGQAIVSVTGLPGGQAALLGAYKLGAASTELRVLDMRSRPPKVMVLAEHAIAGWWLPGGLVAFVRQDGGVLAATFDVERLRFTGPPTPVLGGVRASLHTAEMTVSTNGELFYSQRGGDALGGQFQAVWVTRAGVITPVDSGWTINVALGNRSGGGLAFSPDGRRLAVVIERPGAGLEHDIWIKQLDDGPLTRLTFEHDNSHPVWTADGLSIVHTATQTNRTGAIQRRRADGTGPVDTLLTLRLPIFAVVPTRDTTQFVLDLYVKNHDIVRWRFGDTVTTPLIASPTAPELWPALSPDGRWLAYVSDESGRDEVYVRTYPDVNAGRWQVSQAGGSAPLWSHSGRELFYRNGAKALVAVAVVPGSSFKLGPQVVLFDASRFAENVIFPSPVYDVAPNDQRFVFLRSAGRAGALGVDQLVLVTNWAAEVQAKIAAQKGARP